jgi:hypothetical protein
VAKCEGVIRESEEQDRQRKEAMLINNDLSPKQFGDSSPLFTGDDKIEIFDEVRI